MEESYICSLPEKVQLVAKNELNENPKTRMSDVQNLRNWIKNQPMLIARTDTKTLLRYLRGCKFSQEKARDKIEMYYTSKAILPEMFSGRDPTNPTLRAIYDLKLMVPLSGYDSEGRKVILGRLGAWDPEQVNPELLFKAASMLFDIIFLEDEQISVNGFVQVHDMSGLTMKHVAALRLSLVRKVMTVWTEAYPTRPKAVHYINNSGSFDKLYKIFSKFMKEKMRSRIHVHGNNIENLYEHVPKTMLPEEYGGTGGTMKSLTDHWVNRLEANRGWFLEEESYKAEKKKRSQRIRKKIETITIEESFKKLDID